MLEVKVEKCAGIDVGKKFSAVCVLIGPANRKPSTEAVMESTGSYWKPVLNISKALVNNVLLTSSQASDLKAGLKHRVELMERLLNAAVEFGPAYAFQ